MRIDENLAKKFQNLLDNDNIDTREKLKELFKEELFIPRYSISLPSQRKIALKRLNRITQEGLISVFDFSNNPKRIFSIHEIVGQMDGSTATKMTVQFNLFGGTLLNLGTNKLHSKYLNQIDSLESIGCFGLTELGYGNNAADMQTTATYDHDNHQFILNTPNVLARKYWITNGALHAHFCIVFSRLIIANKDEGIHAFLVPIRDKSLNVLPGVSIWDMGHKIGINGIDNASIGFKNVKISKDCLLSDTSKVDQNGLFSSKINRKRDRFLYVADRLLSGRLCIASMMIGASKYTLDLSINYASKRLAVGIDGKSNNPIINFQLYQRELMPLLAKTICYNFALNYIKDIFDGTKTSSNIEKIILCCSVKATLSWHNEKVATVSRERCGGQGYLSVNRMGEAISGAHSGITAEGDNSVLMQKVSKELLSIEKKNIYKILSYYIGSQFPSFIKRLLFGLSLKSLYKPRVQLKLLEYKKNIILSYLSIRLRKAQKKGISIYDVWMYDQSDEIQLLAKSYFNYKVLEICNKYEQSADSDLKPYLEKIRLLYFFDMIESEMSWYFRQGMITKKQAHTIITQSKKYCRLISKDALFICKSFGIPEHMKLAPMYNDIEKFNSYDNQGELIDNLSDG